MRVDNRSAAALNEGVEKLEDILVLHLEKGKDIFIVTSAKWLKSPFGSSLDEMVAARQPVRPSEAWVCIACATYVAIGIKLHSYARLC